MHHVNNGDREKSPLELHNMEAADPGFIITNVKNIKLLTRVQLDPLRGYLSI